MHATRWYSFLIIAWHDETSQKKTHLHLRYVEWIMVSFTIDQHSYLHKRLRFHIFILLFSSEFRRRSWLSELLWRLFRKAFLDLRVLLTFVSVWLCTSCNDYDYNRSRLNSKPSLLKFSLGFHLKKAFWYW